MTFMTVAEVAEELRVSKMTVHREIQRGNLPALRIGHAFRIKRADFDRYLEQSQWG